MKTISEAYIQEIMDNPEENRNGFAYQQKFMMQPKACAHGTPIRSLYIPKIYTKEAVDFLKEVAKTTDTILRKTINAYRRDPDFRAYFDFAPQLKKWLLLPSQYPCRLPLVRADIFFNEEDFSFQFCEFNADGASAMNHDFMLYQSIQNTPAFRKFAKEKQVAPFEYFNCWVTEFLKIYHSMPGAKSKPTVGIVDFLESAMINDFLAFQKAFCKRGIPAYICDIRDLVLKEQGLYTKDDIKIDAVYRRAVTGEMYKNRRDIPDFLAAVKEEKTCVIGPLSTQIIHDKSIFEVFCHEEALSYLSSEEQNFIKTHIPHTEKLAEANLEKLRKEKDQWILKPSDLYGGKGVYAGRDMPQEAWEALIEKNRYHSYLVQRFVPPYQTKNFDFSLPQPLLTLNNTTGLFIYNGNLVGLLSKACVNSIVTSAAGGYYMASVQML